MIGQVFLTVVSGVMVFVLGQIFVKFILEPIQEFDRLVGQIGYLLIYYANIYSKMDVADATELKEVSETFRQHASELFLLTHMIPRYALWAKLRLLPPLQNAHTAGSDLIGLSYGVYDMSSRGFEANEKRRRRIEEMLDLKTGA